MSKIYPILLITMLITGCAGLPSALTATSTPSGPRTLRVMSHDSFAMSEELLRSFEADNNVTVQIIPSGDTGAALNKAILAKGNPLADVLYGVDNTFLSRALKEDIFDAYAPNGLESIPAELKLDPQMRATPTDFGDVCPNYEIAYFDEKGIPPPQDLADLAKPEYKGLLVVQNPATSSPGLAFMLATIGVYGEEGYLDYWQALKANDVLAVNDWDSAYYGEFSLHGGTRPIVISYGSSPPAEVIFAETRPETAPTVVVSANRSCYRQIEFAGILKGAKERQLAETWLDFMLAPAFQEDMPLQMFVFPANPAARLPPEFQEYTTIPAQTAQVDPAAIEARREQWLQDWTDTVLR